MCTFTYKNDSVLEVDKWDYYHCNTSNPIIAGAPDHCKNGQRIFIEVMDPRPISQSPPPGAVPPEPYLSDSPAPSPSLGVAIAVAPCALFMALIVTFLASVVYSFLVHTPGGFMPAVKVTNAIKTATSVIVFLVKFNRRLCHFVTNSFQHVPNMLVPRHDAKFLVEDVIAVRPRSDHWYPPRFCQ
ncbi:hypothetical protein Prudu_008460 [Prunus dulcis]|uniref:Uncharacterized protein n=1 Tax=Prunus dulcis TaxID=3755 RepID=A0A4Y1R4C0_PRUDU|nr:hypothetical protein Prudu_008460 [Prunus dulcis]